MNSLQASVSPNASSPLALVILMWVAWLIVLLIADFMAFMMLAFADSPNSVQAAKIMIAPLFIWFLVTFVGGIWLLVHRGVWQVPLAFVLAMSSPVVMFIGYNLFSGGGHRASPPVPQQSASVVPVPEGKFVPPTFPSKPQSDFMNRIEEIKRTVAADKEALDKELADQSKEKTNMPTPTNPADDFNPAIANKILEMAQEWGEHFAKPTQPRAAKLYSHLTPAQLDYYDKIAHDAMRIGHAEMYDNPNASRERCAAAVLKKFPWVNSENIARIHSQGQYYANK